MNRLRAKFSKGETVKYISHLDTLRTFERAIRRAGIPITHSQGFNPRPQMSFGLPLSVGVTSDSELVDLEMDEKIKPEEFKERMNSNMPEGFRIIEAGYIDSKESLMSSINVASYKVWTNFGIEISKDNLRKNIDVFLKKDSIRVEKESKGKIKDIDIRADIFELALIDYNEKEGGFLMTLSAGSISNLKPELVIKAFNAESKMELDILRIHRTALYGKDCTELIQKDPPVLPEKGRE
ncbi:MAG: TIGR03936 family radical SAM-associated protein [Deltaproteobacteria bacterium]